MIKKNHPPIFDITNNFSPRLCQFIEHILRIVLKYSRIIIIIIIIITRTRANNFQIERAKYIDSTKITTNSS